MAYTPNDFKNDVLKEIEKGYAPVRIAEFAQGIYEELDVDSSTEFFYRIQGVMMMEMGPEFVMTETQLRNYLDKIVEDLSED
ncbi:hypothetical protein [uncultured Gimesia sp.]|uniref:hypothetical protein n=1 Tax=uncultured Gimesia sp. TaxID=1678688 RepID=UPI0030D743F7|tara:strand:- start:5581 stop:5826 length:246 start_codon:yes stop_codon:yes gene_type:complete